LLILDYDHFDLFLFFQFKFAQIPKDSKVLRELTDLWSRYWRNSDLIDVHQIRDMRSMQTRVSKEKQHFFDDFLENFDETRKHQWIQYSKINGLDLDYIRTPELRNLVRAGLPKQSRGKIFKLFNQFYYFINFIFAKFFHIHQENYGNYFLERNSNNVYFRLSIMLF
jgi:hypothetical protein